MGDGGGAPARRATADQDGADGDTASAAQMENEIEVAPAGRLPFQEASLQVLSASEPAPAIVGDEGQPIDGLDLGTLEAYVGVTGATVIKPAVSTPTAAAAGAAAAVMAAAAGAGPGLSRMETGFSELSNPLELGGRAGGYASSEGDPSVRGPPAVHDETAAQAAARADFRRDTAGAPWWVGRRELVRAGEGVMCIGWVTSFVSPHSILSAASLPPPPPPSLRLARR